ncbi:hypothetical protein [Phenylobacterium sp.]|uniref:hypothetical protein n=1 Tax=Phenylobacterium sp. TaxID=1871053 RepID=UPI00374D3A82
MPGTANSIITPQTPQSSFVACSTANTSYTTSPTNTVLVATAGAAGARLTKLRAIPLASVTATQLQEFRSSDAGTTKRFSNSALMAAYTMAQTTAAPVTDFGYSDDNPKILQAGEQLYVAIGVTGAVGFEAEWANY